VRLQQLGKVYVSAFDLLKVFTNNGFVPFTMMVIGTT